MSVEKRWSERKPIRMSVMLHYEPLGSVEGKTRDISLEGMFVEIPDPALPLHAEVEVSFVTHEANATHHHRVPAYVVHSNERGVGLMIRHVDYQNFHALRDMLEVAA